MTYSQSNYQPSILALARQGNFRAIGYWINSILAPQGIYVQTETTRSGCLRIWVNFRRASNRMACMNARQPLVRHICYRLWTLNSAAIREVKIIGRVSGHGGVLWQQSVRINTPANAHQPTRSRVARSRARSAPQQEFQILRSFLVNRLALAGFIFCYWILYLEATGYQFGEQPTVAATPAQELTQSTKAEVQKQAKTTIAHAPTQPKINFTVPPQFQGQVVYEATPPANAPKVVALTFDDGPWATTTDQILDILQKNNIKATFYWVGKALQENGEIAKKVVAQGHAIGNHTWQHLMDNMDELTAAEELGNNAKLIYQTTGVRTALMRPPGGNLGGELVNYAKKQGYMPTMWSADSSDYLVSTPLIIDNVLSNTKPGGIVLMHDGGGDRSPTVEALPQIITSLQRQGYQFVTVPELMNMQAQWGPIKSAGEEEMVPPSSTEAEKSQSADPALQSTPSPSSQAQPQPDGSPLPNSVPAPTPIPQTNHHLPLNQTPQPDASVQPPSNHSQDSTSQPGNPPQPASTPQSGTTGTTQPNLNPPIHDQSQPVTNPPIRDHAQ